MRNLQERFINGLDGLRAIAVIMVVGYHLKLPIFKGGVLGVTIFFVISGFLITRLLLQELDRNNKIDLKTFWLKRFKRIWPALILTIMVIIIVCAIFNRILFTKAARDFISSLFGFNNWYQIFNDISYFDNGGAPSPLLHCWSLAIETQFYLIFPLIIILINKINKDKYKEVLCGLTGILIIVSTVLMALLFDPAGDPTRVYYGLDTRAFSLLIGALLAVITNFNFSLKKSINDLIGIVSLVIICIFVYKIAGYDAFLYYGGYFIVSILTALVILSILRNNSLLSKVLSFPVLDWLGKLSYSIYLWHYPVIILISGGIKSSWYIMLLEIVVTLVLASLSYYLVETPIRKGILAKTVHIFKTKRKLYKQGFILISSSLLLMITSISCVAFVPRQTVVENKQESTGQDISQNKTEETETINNQYVDLKDDVELINNLDVFVIGDSIVSGSFANFQSTFPRLKLSSKESRQASLSVPILETALNDEGWDGDCLIFALGTNGPLYDYLPKVRNLLPKDKIMFVVSLHAPYDDWTDDNNAIINEFCNNNENVYLIDWANYCKDHSEWFERDQTHPNKTGGTENYLKCIRQSIVDAYQKNKIKLTKKS